MARFIFAFFKAVLSIPRSHEEPLSNLASMKEEYHLRPLGAYDQGKCEDPASSGGLYYHSEKLLFLMSPCIDKHT